MTNWEFFVECWEQEYLTFVKALKAVPAVPGGDRRGPAVQAGRALRQAPLVPIGDPYLQESLHFHA